MKARVQHEDFDPAVEIDRLQTTGAGAIASFIGMVRDGGGNDPVLELELEHYPGMTEAALEAIVNDAIERWQLSDALVVHRVGKLSANERIVLVAVSSPHRKAAFQACEYVIDRLKTEAPLWKKEKTASGEKWVEARESDDLAASRWALD